MKVAKQVIRDWTNMKHEKHWQSICGQGQVGLLKKPSTKIAGELLSLDRHQLRIMTGMLIETLIQKDIYVHWGR